MHIAWVILLDSTQPANCEYQFKIIALLNQPEGSLQLPPAYFTSEYSPLYMYYTYNRVAFIMVYDKVSAGVMI